MMRKIPLLAFLLLAALFGFGIWWSSHHDLNEVPSPLINKPAPEFSLPTLQDPSRRVTRESLLGRPYLLNVFGSWCIACAQEHPLLMRDARQLGVRLIGLNYKDNPVDARRWLSERGDPYELIIADVSGRTAIDFGVYAAPETFLVDAHGVIRYKRIGEITPAVLKNELEPAIAALAKESSP